jgi:predicted transcriptional regulator
MSTHPRCCALDDDLGEVLDDMSLFQFRRMPVCDEGRIVGIISIGDICMHDHDIEETGRALRFISRQDGLHNQAHAA